MKHFANSVQSPDIPDHPKEDQNKIGGFLSFDICDFILHMRPDEIVHMIYAFIITNGLSFRIVEDKYLSHLLPIPISRQKVARVCDTTAKLIDQKITTQALSYREVVGAFD
ncbi:hypothetical protein M9Y10_011556 [Tritrichomonas musculus]|uniref:Uncharacterized protein n=1 Tax=Tritrichomonas musculus TaxID=1915356 RepID=A0ABR2IKH4_9EUKA